MKLKQLIDHHEWDEVQTVLARLYPDQSKHLKGYRLVYETLSGIHPSETRMRILIEEVADDFTYEKYHDVSGRDGTRYRDDPDLSIKPDSEIGNQEIPYAIEFHGWEEWLGMEIDPQTMANYTESEILAHSLYEMTFFGFTQEKIKSVKEGIMRAGKEARDLDP